MSDIEQKALALVTDLAEQLRSHAPSMRRYALDHAAHYSELAADKITALEEDVERYRNHAKQNNNLAKMYKAQADEFRAKYVAAVGGGGLMTGPPCLHGPECNGTGLDCGPDWRPKRKTAHELAAIRALAWETRRMKYGHRGHKGKYNV